MSSLMDNQDSKNGNKSAEINLLMTISQLHNKRKSPAIKEEVLEQVEPRYWFPGTAPDLNTVHYVNPLATETFRAYNKNFKITRLVIRACIGFLSLLKKQNRKLKLLDHYCTDFKYLHINRPDNK